MRNALAGLVAIVGATIWYGDAADHSLGRAAPRDRGDDHRVRRGDPATPAAARAAHPTPSARAVVDLPGGPQRIQLRGTDPDVRGLEYDAWSLRAATTNRYGGRFTVLFDPAHPRQVMEQADATRHRLRSDVAVDRTITLVSTAVVAAFALPLLWDVTPGQPSAHPGATRPPAALRSAGPGLAAT